MTQLVSVIQFCIEDVSLNNPWWTAEREQESRGDEKIISKNENPKEGLSTVKIMGRIFEVFALIILIVDAVLLNMEDKNLPMIDLLLGVGASTFIIGFILSHLLQEKR